MWVGVWCSNETPFVLLNGDLLAHLFINAIQAFTHVGGYGAPAPALARF